MADDFETALLGLIDSPSNEDTAHLTAPTNTNGEGSSRSPLSIKRKRSFGSGGSEGESDMDMQDSDDEDAEGTEVDEKKGKPLKKKAKTELEEGEEEDDDTSKPTIDTPYPYMNLYVDAADKEHIDGLGELEREELLGQRQEQLNAIRLRLEVKAMAEGKSLPKSLPSSKISAVKRKHTSTGTTSAKSQAINDLKKKREARVSKPDNKNGEGGMQGSYGGGGSEDSGAEEGELDHIEDRMNALRAAKEGDLAGAKEYNALLLPRSLIAQKLKAAVPWFDEFVIGTFVRVSTGPDSTKTKSGYMLAEVVGVTESKKPYDFQGFKTSKAATVRLGGKKGKDMTTDFTFLSDKPATDEEWKEYFESGSGQDRVRRQSKKEIMKRVKKLNADKSRAMNELDIFQMIKQKEGYKNRHLSGAGLRSDLILRLQVANSKGDSEEVEKIQKQLQDLEVEKEREMEKKKERNETDVRWERINESHRKKNEEERKLRQIREMEERRVGNKAKYDPSARVRTQPKFMHDQREGTKTPNAANGTATSNTSSTTEQNAVPIPATTFRISKIAAAVDIDLDF